MNAARTNKCSSKEPPYLQTHQRNSWLPPKSHPQPFRFPASYLSSTNVCVGAHMISHINIFISVDMWKKLGDFSCLCVALILLQCLSSNFLQQEALSAIRNVTLVALYTRYNHCLSAQIQHKCVFMRTKKHWRTCFAFDSTPTLRTKLGYV